MVFIWLGLGAVLAIPLLLLANRLKLHSMKHLLGFSLIVAATVYIGFTVVWGSRDWIAVETLGAFFYTLFYWLSIKYSPLWLALGWLLHPVWDVVLHVSGPVEKMAMTSGYHL